STVDPVSVSVLVAELEVLSLCIEPLSVESFMELSELLLPEFQSDELEPRVVLPGAAAPVELRVPLEVVVPLLLVPETFVSLGYVLLESAVGDVVFAFGLPTCEVVD
ncbi:MAG TPA: hypothetical protein VFS47_11965, partial [Steroidobacteraceae bacterium]|nr:hypothetical protein [Steroidobacteraceae bacterium]